MMSRLVVGTTKRFLSAPYIKSFPASHLRRKVAIITITDRRESLGSTLVDDSRELIELGSATYHLVPLIISLATILAYLRYIAHNQTYEDKRSQGGGGKVMRLKGEV